MTVKDLVRPLPGVRRLSLLWQRMAFRGSASYLERRYADGGTSGAGSYRASAEVKAAFLNDFVRALGVGSVVEFGCGDGNQLSLADYPAYIGLDVSRSAIALCQRRFAADPTKSFFLYDGACFTDRGGLFTADLALSRPPLSPDRGRGLRDLPDAPVRRRREVCDRLCDQRGKAGTAPHVRHRRFTPWVEVHRRNWHLLKVTQGPRSGPDCPDFFTYERVTTLADSR